jgi:hypothetical protein
MDVQFRVDRQGNAAGVFFQGSVSRRDWLLDFDACIHPYRDSPVKWQAHHGFVRGYKSVRETIMARLQGVTSIYCSGYSLGAAYGTLFHEDARFNFPDATLCSILFGTPRVVWMPSNKVKERFVDLVRVNVSGDLVSHLPSAFAGFRHVGAGCVFGPKYRFYSPLYHLIPEYRKQLSAVEDLDEYLAGRKNG